MMINKNRFCISNDKKVLHKIGKRWVTVSALTLSLLGGAAAASTVTTHAAATPAVEAQHTDNVKKQINSNLNSAANSNNTKSTATSAQSSNATKPSAVQSSAANMHNALLQNAANQKPSVKSTGSSIASNAPIHQSAQPNSEYEAYLKQNPQLAQDYYGNATPSASSKATSNAPKDNVSASSIASNSSASSVSANNSKVSSANQISDKKNKPLMLFGNTLPTSGTLHSVNGKYGQYITVNSSNPAKWNLDNDGTLLIHDGDIGETLNAWNLFNSSFPGANRIKHIKFYKATTKGSLAGMFAAIPSLESIDFTGLNETSNTPISFSALLMSNPNLRDVNLGHLNTNEVVSDGSMFNGDYNLQTIQGLSNINMNNIKDLNDMFENCSSLTSLDLSNFDTSTARANQHSGNGGNGISNLISGCTNLRHLKLGNNSILTDQAINGSEAGSYALNNDGTVFPLANGKAHPGDWTLLQGIDSQGKWNTTNWVLTKNGDLYLTGGQIDTSRADAKDGNNQIDWSKVQHIYTNNVKAPQDCDTLFGNAIASSSNSFNPQTMDLSGMNFSDTTNFFQTFNNDTNLTSLIMPTTNWGNNNISDASYMFSDVPKLKRLDMPYNMNLTHAKVDFMFDANPALQYITLPGDFGYNPSDNSVFNSSNGFDSNLATVVIPSNSRITSNMNLQGNWINLSDNDLKSIQGTSGLGSGTWTRNAEIINLQDGNGNIVYTQLLKAPLGTQSSVENTPMFIPMEYKLANPSQSFTYNGGTIDVPVKFAASDVINSASSLVNSDLIKTQYLASADSNDGSFATTQINSINSDVSSIQADINAINTDKGTENSSNADAEIASANNAYDNAYSANAAIESMMNTSLSTDSSEIGSLSTQINNSVSSIVNNDIKPDEAKYNQATTNASNALTSLTSEDGRITANSTSATSFSNELSRINGDINNDESRIGNDESNINKHQNNIDSLSTDYNTLSGDYTNLSNSIQAVSGAAQKASTAAQNALTSAGTNSGAINGIKNELSNYNTISSDAVNAMSSLNADENELGWLANSESALSTGSSQASSNAGWIKANSASVSALSQNFHDVYNKIQQDSTALNQAIGSKADTSDLTNKYNALSGDITNAFSLANDADKLAKGNAGEISNLKANTAITFTFTQDGSNVLTPITMTNGYIEANAQSHSGNTYDITNLLDNAVASKGKHAVGTYTVTLGNDNNGNATLNFKAQPQKKFGVGMSAPSADNGMTTFKLGTPAQQRKAWNFVQYGLNNHKGLILGAANRVPSSTDTSHDVVLANNQAEYKGDIILNFGSHQTKVPFDTGSTNPKVLASDKVNLLNYAQNAQNPSDFTKDNLISGFDTTGFSFDSATSTPNNQYSFTIQPSDATNQSGDDFHSNYNITLNYTAQPVTENIQYMYGSHIENVNKTTTTAKGTDDTQSNWNSTNNLKPGWTLATTDNKFTFTNNGTAEINVAPVQTSDTINYVDQKGNQVGSQTFIGNNYQATDAGNNDIKLSDLESVVPSGYKLQNANSDKAIGFDGGTYTVNVIGNARSPKNTVPSSTKPSDANNPKSNKSMTKPTGDSDVLFTINVQDYNADGTKEINHYTKYTTESGEVGDLFTIKASDYLTNGFNINTSKSADNNVSGTISDNQLKPNSVTFNYYAKASSFDPNKAKTDPNYVKKYNADPTTPKPITVQYIGEFNGQSNQVVKTYSDAITGDTGDTGTLSNIESVAPVPQGYNVNGNSYNYTITTDPQTIKVNLNSKTAKQMNNGNQNYKPATPSDKPSSKVPSDNTVKKDASHGFATVIINENINGKVAHQSAQTVDESNLGVGDSYTIEPTSFTPKGYQADSNDKALTGTVNPDGSLSNGSATFTYDVNDSEIASITVTYYNQFGDLIDVNTGKTNRTGENVTASQATVTIQPAQLATKGAIGDYVDITGFLTAPKGHHFNKSVIDSSNHNLDHVQLQQAKNNKTVHLGLTLFEAMPKPQPKPTPKPKSNSSASTITPASASAEIQSAASSAAQSASASASASAASAEQSAVTSAANSAAQNNGSAATSTEQSMAKADASSEAHDDAVASATRSAAGSAEASAAVSAADEVRSAEANHNDSKAIVSVKASAASAERSAAKSAAQSAKASATDSVEDSIASSEDNQEAHASQNSEAPSEPVEHGSQMIGGQNAEPSHEANVQREAASYMVGVSNKLAQPSTTVHASRVGSNDQNANGHKLPQTNEAKAAGLMGAASIMAALGLAGADTDRKRRRE